MYNPSEVEARWLKEWKGSKLFQFDEGDTKRPVFAIDTPPPFTNGALHMGQVYWVCYVDSIARYMRMSGRNVLYPQGWDVHGFPTELAVEKKYGKGLSKAEFLKRAVEMSNENISAMKEQMLRLGATFDQKLEYSTLSNDYTTKVQLALLHMFKKGLVYRADHPVPWCVNEGTAISREQTSESERKTNLNYVEFALAEPKGKATVTIATTRPELMHACVAIAVNPRDERYASVVGKKVTVPVFGGKVEVIADDTVDKDFGTGAEMVCTFGDKDDIKMFYRHNLRLVQAMDARGRLTNAGKFTGMGVKEARAVVLAALKEDGVLKRQETITHVVKTHDRCGTEIEFLSYTQWFIRTKDNAGRIKELASEIKWSPDQSRQRLLDWADSLEWDWNISRHRMFGTPIPFWYCELCGEVQLPEEKSLPVDPSVDKPPSSKCTKCGGVMVGEKDTLDGWVDTCITPLVISGWPDRATLAGRAFPAAMRIQGNDIVRTWAFYTIFGTWAVSGSKPWESILVHGMILGDDGREMHKSLGNGVLPSDLMKDYSSDSIRMWVALSGSLAKEKPFSRKELEHAKGFITKLYNTAVFVQGALAGVKLPENEPTADMNVFDIWILSRFNKVVKDVKDAYGRMELYDAMNTAMNFYWHEFADYYIENVKHRVYSKDRARHASKLAAAYTLRYVLLNSLKLFAPVIPFVCEEVNTMFHPKGKSIFASGLPEYIEVPTGSHYVINGLLFKGSIVETGYENAGAFLNDVIAEVRKAKAREKLALNKEIASININVPDEYNSAVQAAKDELKQICKAREVKASKSDSFSVSVTV